MMEIRAGASVTDRFRLSRPLGRGGMGHVWVADQVALDTQVAIKFVSSELAGDAEMIERFTREAKLAAQIKSPHVVQIFDHAVTSDGTAYIVMELLEGESLAGRLRREGSLPPAEVARILEQVARALSAAHELEIVHRDIKPENIFLSRAQGAPDGESFVKVLDFGIARRTESETAALTRTGAIIGTPGYMSPEQLDDTSRVGPSTDLWAMSVAAYQCLTGKLPFEGASAVSVWRSIQAQSFTPASRARDGLPAGLDGWFSRAFALDAASRFPSARAMADAFHAIVGAGPVSDRHDGDAIASAPTILASAASGSASRIGSVAGDGTGSLRIVLLAVAAAVVVGLLAIVYLTLQDPLVDEHRPPRASGAGSATPGR
jgi:eukaryotic-like serine/threonine-protein kinase